MLTSRTHQTTNFYCKLDTSCYCGTSKTHAKIWNLDYSRLKSQQLVGSKKGTESNTLTDAFDWVKVIAADLFRIFREHLLVCISTVFEQAFIVITHGKRPTKIRLANDISAPREVYLGFGIELFGPIRGKNNLADALTKLCLN